RCATHPAPVVELSLLLSPYTRHLVARFGARPVSVAGSLFVTATPVILLLGASRTRDYTGVVLPAMLTIGIGVGLAQATMFGTVAGVLPPNRFATGSGVLNMARQIALAIGVAAAVAILGATPALHDFRASWWFMAGAAFLSAVVGLLMPARPQRP